MEPETSDKRTRVRRAMRILALFIACGLAVGIAAGVLYDPHASATRMGFHIAAAWLALGIVAMLVGIVIVALVALRGGDVPPRDRAHR